MVFGGTSYYYCFPMSNSQFSIAISLPAKGHMTPMFKTCLIHESAVELKYLQELQLGQSFNSILSQFHGSLYSCGDYQIVVVRRFSSTSNRFDEAFVKMLHHCLGQEC